MGLRVAAQVPEVEVADWRRLGLVQSGARTLDTFHVAFRCFGVPGYSEAIHVKETVTHLEESVV